MILLNLDICHILPPLFFPIWHMPGGRMVMAELKSSANNSSPKAAACRQQKRLEIVLSVPTSSC